MGRIKSQVLDIKEQISIEYFKGDFDNLDELFDKVAEGMKVDRSTVEYLYNEMTQDNADPSDY